MFHELVSRDLQDGRATGQSQGIGPEAHLNGASQGPIPEDARKDGHIGGRSKLFMERPGYDHLLFSGMLNRYHVRVRSELVKYFGTDQG
jgi:hypothetical protein